MVDKFQLAERIRSLEGLTTDERSALLALLNEQKKYGLVWESHVEDAETLMADQLPVLEEVVGRRIVDKENPNHILIEGDNLHALTCLSYTHEGKIDVIYIDPPYNTGNKDFVYNDNFVNKDDSYRHSKWLSFMHKRLRIARRLLSDRGVIFISIDDNEQANLKLLCDEVFGEQNFVGKWCWYKSATPPNLSYKIRKNIEYVLCYERIKNNSKYQGVKKESKSDDPITKPQNTIKKLIFPPNSIYFKGDDGVIKAGVYGTAKFPNILCDDMIIENGVNVNAVSFENKFIWLQDKLEEELKKGTRINCSKSIVLSYKKVDYDPVVPSNFIDISVGVDTTENAGRELSDIIGDGKFDYPKPTSLIRYLLNFIPANTILDFFAGSGTTLHAVMQLNKEDGGHRRCILVTNNENGICENVTYERNRRVIQGYTNQKGEQVAGLTDNNLRYYRTTFVPRERTQRNMRALVNAATDLLCIKENLYDEQDFYIDGKKLRKNIARWFGGMLIIYQEEFADMIAAEIAKMDLGGKKLKVYIFSPSRYAFDDSFYDVQDKVQPVALPAAIYDAYKRILPKQKDKLLKEIP